MCPHNYRKIKVIQLTDQQRLQLEDGFRQGKSHAHRMRCRAVLLKSTGLTSEQAGEQTDMPHISVNSWVKRFEAEGIKGLETRPGRGRKPIMDCSDEESVRKAMENDRQSVNRRLHICAARHLPVQLRFRKVSFALFQPLLHDTIWQKKLDYGYCKAAPMLEWLGNKWALVVLMKISESGPVRFNELYRSIPSMSEKVLSQVLRQLTADGIIRRKLFADVPPRTEYSVTDFGRTLLPHVQALINWGRQNFDTIMRNRQTKE